MQKDEPGWVCINLPFTARAAWGQSVRYVKGTLNGVAFHGSIGVQHGQYFMPLNKDLQKAASLEVGDSLTVTMEPDQAQIKEFYLSKIEEVDAELRTKFHKLYQYY